MMTVYLLARRMLLPLRLEILTTTMLTKVDRRFRLMIKLKEVLKSTRKITKIPMQELRSPNLKSPFVREETK
jgi:hypothetical protein